METAMIITAFTTLLVVIDPIGLMPVFLALTQGATPAARRRIAIHACFTAALILLGFAMLGEELLGFIGISMPAFRIAGGVLLFLTALDMLFERRQKRRKSQTEESEEEASDDPSIFPLAIPLIAGPGAIASIILLTGQTSSPLGLASVLGVMLAVIGLVFAFFMAAGYLEKLLGKTGITVATRLLGILLAALSVQFILDGLASFGFVN